MIDIGGIPITAYPKVDDLLSFERNFGAEGLYREIDHIYDAYKGKKNPKYDVPQLLNPNFTKHELLGFSTYLVKGEPFFNMF